MANCVDNTFRLRVTCAPCTVQGGICCDNVPRQLCLTLSNQNFPAGCTDLDLNGRSVVLNYEGANLGPHFPDCMSPTSGYGVVQQAWSGELVVPCATGYSSHTFHVALVCCLGHYYGAIYPTGGAFPCGGSISRNCPGIQYLPALAFGWGGDYVGAEGVVTCSPFEVTGTFSWLGHTASGFDNYPLQKDWTIDGDIVPIPAGGCGSDVSSASCCADELGTHPNLHVEMTASAFVGNGGYTATWSGSAYTWGPTGTNNFMWAMTCPSATAPAGNAFLVGIGDAFASYDMNETFTCNPFAVVFHSDGQAPDYTPVTISVTL